MTAAIHKIHIQRFRSIEDLTWCPGPGLNLLLGGGNVGKTSLLDAIGLLLSPTTNYSLQDIDYFRRQVEDGFLIEAVMTLPDGVNRQSSMAWPWEWDGTNAVLAAAGDAPPDNPRPPVYKVRVRGTDELELVYEVLQPDETAVSFSVGLRRQVGVVRLLGDDRNDRDLRMVQGSNLDRLINDRGLRARLGRELAADAIDQHLDQDASNRLETLDADFAERKLPRQLGLALTGGAGQSINSLIGLTSNTYGVVLPLTSWGAGTRRLAALAIGDALQEGHPITLVDELERGLEPYRQRLLVEQISEARGQSFVTTHSAAVLNAASRATAWYVNAGGQIGRLETEKIARHLARDSEAFLARLSIVAEGATEVGFLQTLLDAEIPGWKSLGIHITDGCGNDDALTLLEVLSRAGVRFGGFVDNEGRDAGRWRTVKGRVGNLVFQWHAGNLEENVLPMFRHEHIQQLIQDPSGEKTGLRLRTLADRLEVADTDFEALTERARELLAGDAAGEGHPLVPWIVDAASGKVPEHLANAPAGTRNPFKGHASAWFKSLEGGHELAVKVRDLGVWEAQLSATLRSFLTAVNQAQAAGVGGAEELRV